ncbi:C-type lectin domain family 17, member A-like [Carassius auratus]|uniref:C-type lectin domain family 17, member A-like n=1 Tax=Carassius auratus TaxID=7957 RepID=A0A6P6NQS5_CARAU|nr:C-type lectin domain family 17, member A-like [Carassius auratus]
MGKDEDKEMNIYANEDSVNLHNVTTETENTRKYQTPQHTGIDCVKIRRYRAAVVCLVLLCVLLLTAVIALCVHIHTNNTDYTGDSSELLINITNLAEEKDQLLTRNTDLTEKTDQLRTKIVNLTEARDQLVDKNMQLAKERDGLLSSNRDLIKQRDQLHQEKNELLKSIHGMDGWIYYQSNLYFVSSEKKSWTESRRYCAERGADLIIINNREEHDFVKKISANANVWIGLTDSEVEGSWKWVDGSTLTSGFWDPREPNGHRGENCALTYSPGWADYACSDLFQWICEKSILK